MDQVSIFFFFSFFFWLHCAACGISQCPNQGWNSCPRQCKSRVLTTGPTGKPQVSTLYTLSLHSVTSQLNLNKRKKSARYFASILLLTNSSCFQRFAVINSPAMSLPMSTGLPLHTCQFLHNYIQKD